MKKNTKTLLSGIGIFGIASALLVTGASASSQNTGKFTANRNDPQHQAVHTALQSNDYSAFKLAMEKISRPSSAPQITEALFAKMIEAEKLRQSGDYLGAQKVMQSVGLAKKDGTGSGGITRKGKRGMQSLTDAQKTAWQQSRMLIREGKIEDAKKILNTAGVTLPFGFFKNIK